MLLKHLRNKNPIKKLFCSLINKADEDLSSGSESPNDIRNLLDVPLNDYLIQSLTHLGSTNVLKKSQVDIINSISKSHHSMILCDDYSGRKYSCILGIMNRIISNPCHDQDYKEEFFVNTVDTFKIKKDNLIGNRSKSKINPRGALVICQKFEFATYFYRITRRLDFRNKLKLVRDDKNSDSDEKEEIEKQEMLIGNLNLINTTDWKNIDILFITPQMLDYVLSQKEDHDDYDINPEIIMIDDFDYLFGSAKYDLKKCLVRYFGTASKFSKEINEKRKLILTSSSIQNADIFKKKIQEEPESSVEVYKNYLNEIKPNFFNEVDLVISPLFMNIDFHFKEVKLNIKTFEGEGKILVERKLKALAQLVDSRSPPTIVCVSETNIPSLKEHFKRRRISYCSVDETERVGSRLFSIMEYNKYDSNILLITPIFLKSLNLVRISQIILFDFTPDVRDLLRIVSKFPKSDYETMPNNTNNTFSSNHQSQTSSQYVRMSLMKNNMHLFVDTVEEEKNSDFLVHLSNLN